MSSTGKGVLSDVSALLVHPSGLVPAIRFSGSNLRQLLEASTWAYAAMTANAMAAASLPLRPMRAGNESEQRLVEIRQRSHPLAEFLRYPFGYQQQPRWTSKQLIAMVALQLYLCGNSYLEIRRVRGGSRLVLKMLVPTDVEPIDDGEVITSYRVYRRLSAGSEIYRTGPAVREIAPRNMIHIMFPDPGQTIVGQSPMRVAIRPSEIDRQAQERVRAHLINKVGPGLIFAFEGEEGIAEEQQKEMEAYLAEKHQKAEQDGLPMVLGNVRVIQAPTELEKLAYGEVRNLARDELFAIFKTPPPLVGNFESATLQNIRNAREIWWGSAIFPLLQNILDAINLQAIEPIYGGDVEIGYDEDESDIGLDRLERKADIGNKLTTMGHSTNDASQRVGLGMPVRPELDNANRDAVIAGREPMPEPAAAAQEPAPAEAAPLEENGNA